MKRLSNEFWVGAMVIVVIGISLVACGPTAEEMYQQEQQRQQQDALKDTLVVVPTVNGRPDWHQARHIYNASDFGLVPGVIVRWYPEGIDEEDLTEDKFPEAYIHIKTPDGTVKVLRANSYIWKQLNTYDTLR